jgi:hypothetical protein
MIGIILPDIFDRRFYVFKSLSAENAFFGGDRMIFGKCDQEARCGAECLGGSKPIVVARMCEDDILYERGDRAVAYYRREAELSTINSNRTAKIGAYYNACVY